MAGILIYNPTPKVIRAMYDGGVYLFRPYERKEIFNTVCGKTIVLRWEKHGLVDITYDDRVAKKFFSHEIYVHQKAIEGCERYMLRLLETSQGFEVFDDECGDRKQPERFIMQKKHDVVKKDIKEAETLLGELKATDLSTLKRKEADELKKRAEELIAQASALDQSGDNDGKNTVNTQNAAKKRTP